MDYQRFACMARILSPRTSRRSTLGYAAVAVAGILGLSGADRSIAKTCKKSACGPCRRCKKGKCKPNPNADGAACGPCRRCAKGRCQARCPSADCVNDICRISCDPACGPDQECIQGTCFTACDPPCAGDRGCVDGACVDLSGGCTGQNACAADQEPVSCPSVGAGTSCYVTAAGDPFCAVSLTCRANGSDLCQNDDDCRLELGQPNARCIPACAACAGPLGPGSGCVEFYADAV